MRKPFPELTHLQLRLRAYDGPATVVPDSFVDGSAPRLRYLNWDGIPYPGLPKLLISCTDPVALQRFKLQSFNFGMFLIPATFHPTRDNGHSPLRVDRPRNVWHGFQSPRSRPIRESRGQHPAPLIRAILSVILTCGLKVPASMWFQCTSTS